MQGQQEGAARTIFIGIQNCPNCGEEIHGAIAAEYISELHIRNVWWCDSCHQLCRTSAVFDFDRTTSMDRNGKVRRLRFYRERMHCAA